MLHFKCEVSVLNILYYICIFFSDCNNANCRVDKGYHFIAEICLCIKYFSHRYSYTAASLKCQDDGTELIKIDSTLKQAYVKQYLGKLISCISNFNIVQDEFEDTKGGNQNPYIEEEQTTRKKKYKRTSNDLKNRGELRCSGRVSSSCSTSTIYMKQIV